ncbi:hypothetical protein HC02_04915 [Vibrio parahaemolyticus]|nr:hypothetical protein HC02_04915 [Vibrio parahaemolyticus]
MVAEQVRELSAKSSQSAIEIRHLLDRSEQEVKHGQDVVTSSTERMNTIIQQVTTISHDVQSLSSVMATQMTALKELDEASSEVANGVVNTKSIARLWLNMAKSSAVKLLLSGRSHNNLIKLSQKSNPTA